MFGKSIMGLLVLGFGFLILTVTILPISNKVDDLRTDSVTDTGLACTTGASETYCTVTLSSVSAYEPVAPRFVVTETSPGSVVRTTTSVLNSNLSTVTISGLSTGTSYVFTIDYFKVDTAVQSATHLDSLLKRWNLFMVLGTLVVLVLGVGLSFNYQRA